MFNGMGKPKVLCIIRPNAPNIAFPQDLFMVIFKTLYGVGAQLL